ncbi:MAG: alginate export family protein, partial [Verrucomicrobiota bacterium]
MKPNELLSRNPKLEIRSTKEIRMSETRRSVQPRPGNIFLRGQRKMVSIFGFRISKLTQTLTGSALVLLAAQTIYASDPPAPAPSKPSAGLLNDYLRHSSTNLTAWDIGGSLRLRYEDHEGNAIAGSPGSLDFRDHGAKESNDYYLSRLRFHLGYTDEWWGAYVEGRSSLARSDDRFASTAPVPAKGDGPESDSIDLHQAYFTLGNLKEFPLSLKIGRQELAYGDERLVGPVGWNNIGRVFDAAKLRWQTGSFGVDVFTSRTVIPEDGRFNVENDYDFFSGIYATTTIVPKNTVDLYFFARNSSP